MIVNDRITDYIHSLESSQGSLLDSIEQEALRDRVPIIRRETAALLRTWWRPSGRRVYWR